MANELKTNITADNSNFKAAIRDSIQSAKMFSSTIGKALDTTVTRYGALFSGFYTVKGLLNSAVKSAYDFSKQMSLVQSMTQASAEQMKFMEQSAIKMSQITLFSSADITRAMQITGNVRGELFDDPAALVQTTKSVLDLSQAMGISTEQSAKTLGSTMNQFGAATTDAAHYANAIAAATKYGAAEADDLAVSLSYVGGAASQMGLSLEETLATLEALSRQGIVGSKAGTSFARVLMGMNNSGDLSINPQIVGWSTAIKNLKEQNLGLTESQKLFGQWGLKAGLAIQKQSGYIDEILPKIKEYNKLTDQAAERNKSFAGRMDQFKNAAANFGTALVTGGDKDAGGFLGASTWLMNEGTSRINNNGGMGWHWMPGYETATNGGDFLTNRLVSLFGGDKMDPNKTFYDPNASTYNARRQFNQLNGRDRKPQEDLSGDYGMYAGGHWMTNSFIPSIVTGAKSIESFTESVTEASNRLKNSFQALSDDMEATAKSGVMDKIFQPVKDKFNKAVEEGVSDNFIQDAQKLLMLGEQYRFETNENKKNALYDQIGVLQENLNSQTWNKDMGSMSAGYDNGGTFSSFGEGNMNGAGGMVQKSILLELNKRMEQLTEKDKQVTITGEVKVTPDTPTFIKFTKAAANQMVAEEAAGTSL